MTSRELFNGVMQTMDTQSIQIAALAEQNTRIERKVDSLLPRSDLPMIPRPIQGVDYARTCNVAEYVDNKIKAHNNSIPENAPRYLEFAAGRTHDDLNRSALVTMGGILARKFGDNYGGHKTWEKLHKARPQACEEVIEEARLRPEFHVFSQVDGQWCLRELAKNKIKSLFRTSRSRRQNEVDQNNEQQADRNEPNVQHSVSPGTESNGLAHRAAESTGTPIPTVPRASLRQNMNGLTHDNPVTGQERNDITTSNAVRETVSESLTGQSIGETNVAMNDRLGDGSNRNAGPGIETIPTSTGSQLPIAPVQPTTVGARRRAPRSGLHSRNVRTRRS